MVLKPSATVITPIDTLCARITYGVDITQPDTLPGHFENIDTVYHLAGLISFWRKSAHLLMRVNADGTKHICRAARAAGVRRLIHISSVAAVGYNTRGAEAIDETYQFNWSSARHKHYMYSKHLAEEAVIETCDEGLNAVIVNPGLMWGPGDMLNSYKLILGLLRRKVPACPPGGTNIVDVRDVARILPVFREKGETRQRYILGGHNISFREVYQVIASALGVAAPARTLPRFTRPILYWLAWLNESVRRRSPQITSDNIDSSFRSRFFLSAKAAGEAGWKPEISFQQLIRDSIDWLRAANQLDGL